MKYLKTGLMIGITAIYSLFGCGGKPGDNAGPNNTIGPSNPDKPVLVDARYPEKTSSINIEGTLDFDGEADSAIIKIDGIEQRLQVVGSKINVTLPAGDGDKNIDTKIKGPGGFGDFEDSDITTLDQNKPIAKSISSKKHTNSLNLETKLSAEHADSMFFGGEGITSTGMIPYDTLAILNLTTAEGQKDFYVLFSDKQENTSDTLKAITNYDITFPEFPKTLKDTIVYDSIVDWGVFQTDGLISGYFKVSGATTDSGSINNINSIIYNEGDNHISFSIKDSAGNTASKTFNIYVAKMDSEQLLDLVKDYYASKGISPSDLDKKFSATDSNFKTYAIICDSRYDVNGNNHFIKVYNVMNEDVKSASEYTTAFNKSVGFPGRCLALAKDFYSTAKEKIEDFFSENSRK